MKHLSKIKMFVTTFVFAMAMVMAGVTAEAKVITEKQEADKTIHTIGDTYSIHSVSGLKINKKKYSKMKSKVKTTVTGTYPGNFSYKTKSYFRYSDSYSTYGDYTEATEGSRKYIAENSYKFRFLKAGTYTITYNKYEMENLDNTYAQWDPKTGKDQFYITKYDSSLGERKSVDNKLYYKGSGYNSDDPYYDYDMGEYFISVDGKSVYARDDSWNLVKVSFKKDANGEMKAYYAPVNVIKKVYTDKIKVIADNSIVKSVQLGKSKITASKKNSKYSNSGTYTSSKFLSGKSGKLTVKMSNSNYKITSIVVKTYDAQGKAVYALVKNKKKVNFGMNKVIDSYDNGYGYAYSRTSMYKPTEVYINYQNKFTGEYSKINKIYKDQYGNYSVDYEYKYANDDKKTVVVGGGTGVVTKPSNDYSSGNGTCQRIYTFYKK